MKKQILVNDPEAVWVRKVMAARRVGANPKCCKCDEIRPRALNSKSNPKLCHECNRKKEGKSIMDDHHVFAKSNSPITVPTPVNDHRAELSDAQYKWPKRTLKNPDGSPLLAAAGVVRGFIDYVHYLIDKGLAWVVLLIEAADAFLVATFGSSYWIGTELEKFAPMK